MVVEKGGQEKQKSQEDQENNNILDIIYMTDKERILYFIFGCIALRLVLAYLPLYLSKKWLPKLGVLTFIIGISFLYLYFTNGRMNAPEGGGVTWWANYRLLHGFLYITASIYLFQSKKVAWIPLMIDVLFGLIMFIKNKL